MIRFFSTDLLRKTREKLCTQKEMAGLINTTARKRMFDRNTYAFVEQGNRGIDSDSALIISRLLKKDINKLFIGEEVDNEQ